jgi:hypothetical protein
MYPAISSQMHGVLTPTMLWIHRRERRFSRHSQVLMRTEAGHSTSRIPLQEMQ